MKVTGIKTYICNAYRTNLVFCKITTDSGITGVGEATLEYRAKTVEQAIKELERYIVGKDPHNIEAFWHDTYRDAYWRGGPVLMSALSGVEMALWDIKGKDLNVPVYQLLGGKCRDRITSYANGWFSGAKKPEEFAEKARQTVELGFKGLKWDPFGTAWQNINKKDLVAAIECVEAVTDAVGNEIEIMIEGHGRFNIPTAVRIAQELERFKITWFEEPIPPDNLSGLAELKQRVNVPIAAGERIFSRYDYREFFKLGCADFIQPDISHAGGIFELKKIAAMAETHHIPICPHNPIGPIANGATLQLAACTPNFAFIETMNMDVTWRKDITNEKLFFDNGDIIIPDKPGLGIDINEDAIAEHPYEVINLRHFKGTLTDIRPASSCSIFTNI